MLIIVTNASNNTIQQRYVEGLTNDDVILLKEEGVYQYAQLQHLAVKVLDEDAKARGVAVDQKHRLSMSQWVALHNEHQHWLIL